MRKLLGLISALSLTFIRITSTCADDAIVPSSGILALKADSFRLARASYATLPVMPGILSSFYIFLQSPGGDRKVLLTGPWDSGTLPGRLSRISDSEYAISADDPGSGASYRVHYKQVSPEEIRLTFSIKPPESAGNLQMEYEICKLSGDLFKGAELEMVPAIHGKSYLPVEPLPVEKRFIVIDRNELIIKGKVCTVVIKDLTQRRSINLCDFRKYPFDSTKSFYFFGHSRSLIKGKSNDFQYSIRFLPSSAERDDRGQLSYERTFWRPADDGNPWKFFSVAPKHFEKASGRYVIQSGDVVSGPKELAARVEYASELKKLTGMFFTEQTLTDKGLKKGVSFVRSDQEEIKKGVLPPEGFEITIRTDSIVVRGADARGCLYGAYALLGMIRRNGAEWGIPCGVVRDWPDLRTRGLCIEMGNPFDKDVEMFKRYLRSFSRARANLVILNFEPHEVVRWHTAAGRRRWSSEEISEIVAYARYLEMEVWAGMGSKYNRDSFPGLAIAKGAEIYDPRHDASYNLIFALYQRIIDVIKPSVLLIGHDEIKGLSLYASEDPENTAGLLSSDVTRIYEWLAKRGVGTAMWGDMLLDATACAGTMSEPHSQNPLFNSGATHRAIEGIPKAVKILDWHYVEETNYPSFGYFRRKGFLVFGNSWHDPRAAKAIAAAVKDAHGEGIIGTDWGLMQTLSAAATTLYAPLCGWTVDCSLIRDDVEALAASLRRDDSFPDSLLGQVQVDLLPYSNSSTWDVAGKGVFGTGPVLDLRALFPGKWNIGGVSFILPSADKGSRNNCIVSTSGSWTRTIGKETEIKIADQTAKQIAFLQTSFVEAPQINPRKIGEYVITFVNGRKATVELTEGINITDVRSSEGLRRNVWLFNRSPDVLLNSLTGWRGQADSGLPLNLQLFVWQNPYAGEKIRSIKLRASNQVDKVRLVLLGVTLLQSE